MSQWLVTHAERSDLSEIAQLVNSVYRSEAAARTSWTSSANLFSGPRTSVELLEQNLSEPNPSTILCLREHVAEPILASVFLEKMIQEDGSYHCYLGMLAVSLAHQKQGLGRFMLQQGEQYARDWGADRVAMTVVFLRESLIAWYERCGFQRTGKKIPFSYEESMGQPLRDDLYLVVLEKLFPFL